jgi:hypothetical protein
VQLRVTHICVTRTPPFKGPRQVFDFPFRPKMEPAYNLTALEGYLQRCPDVPGAKRGVFDDLRPGDYFWGYRLNRPGRNLSFLREWVAARPLFPSSPFGDTPALHMYCYEARMPSVPKYVGLAYPAGGIVTIMSQESLEEALRRHFAVLRLRNILRKIVRNNERHVHDLLWLPDTGLMPLAAWRKCKEAQRGSRGSPRAAV